MCVIGFFFYNTTIQLSTEKFSLYRINEFYFWTYFTVFAFIMVSLYWEVVMCHFVDVLSVFFWVKDRQVHRGASLIASLMWKVCSFILWIDYVYKIAILPAKENNNSDDKRLSRILSYKCILLFIVTLPNAFVKSF